MKIGWERENRKHFDDIVQTYDTIRPNYPAALFNDVLAYAGSGRTALEIGAGTGKATAPFLKAGYDVTAVEIGENMAAFLRDQYIDEAFNVIVGAFEDIVLDENGYDLVYAASAFHWVDAAVGIPKVLRLLKSGGAFALMRYYHRPVTGELYEEIQDVYKKYFHPYVRPKLWKQEDFGTPVQLMNGFRIDGLHDFTDISMKLYPITRTYSTDEYRQLIDTMSDHRSLPEHDRLALYDGISAAINRHGGQFTIDYTFQLYMGRKS